MRVDSIPIEDIDDIFDSNMNVSVNLENGRNYEVEDDAYCLKFYSAELDTKTLDGSIARDKLIVKQNYFI
jgi:hypothetical protein